MIALLDQSFENLGAGPQSRLDLRQSVFAVGPLNDEISGALQQRQKRDEKKEKPPPETAKAKFQR
jgi:hypothetical protein